MDLMELMAFLIAEGKSSAHVAARSSQKVEKTTLGWQDRFVPDSAETAKFRGLE
jgi:hypothetical protein